MIMWWCMPSQTVIQDYSRHPANCPEYRTMGIPAPLPSTIQCTMYIQGRPCATITYRSARYICTIVCMTQAIGSAFRGWSRLEQTSDTHDGAAPTKGPLLGVQIPLWALLQWPPNLTIIILFIGREHENWFTRCLDYKHNWMHPSEKRHEEESNVWKTPCQRSAVLTSSKWSLAVCAWVCADMVVYGPQDPDWVTGTQLRGTVGHR